MRMLLKATAIALSLLSGAALAQNAAAPMSPSNANPYTLQSLDKTNPFGSVDIKSVDPKDHAKLLAWSGDLNDQQKLDLTNRCGVINQNNGSFSNDAVAFCTGWNIAMADEEPVKGSPNAVR